VTDQPVPDPHDERNTNPSGLPDGPKKVPQPVPPAPTDPDDTAGTPV
jgi:hypothetical protein